MMNITNNPNQGEGKKMRIENIDEVVGITAAAYSLGGNRRMKRRIMSAIEDAPDGAKSVKIESHGLHLEIVYTEERMAEIQTERGI